MGSYLFKLTGRLSETNHVYESFNIHQPELIRKVHLDYLAAGAQCLKTNTFGANRRQLEQFNMANDVVEINSLGCALARQAINEFQSRCDSLGPFFVLGSVGSTVTPLTTAAAVAECYRQQLEALVAGGVDALLLETFHSLPQLEWLIQLINSLPTPPPVIAEITLRAAGSLAISPLDFIGRMTALGVTAAGVNCCAPWDASSFVDEVMHAPAVRAGDIQLVVMPNAGGFQNIGNRFMTTVNPESAGIMARSLAGRGVRLLGGCCEMHPPHIQEMHNYLQSRTTTATQIASPLHLPTHPPSAGDNDKRSNGPFSRKLKDGQFVVSIEMLPPRGTDERIIGNKIDGLAELAASGLIDAVDLTDGSRGIPLIAPGDFIHLIRDRLQWTAATGDPIELIPHFTSRDLNLMGVQSRLVGYHANRIHNALFITGDPPKMSPTYPRSTAVFDVDSVELIRLTNSCLNAGVDFGGVPLGKQSTPRTHFTIGAGVEPEAQDQPRELDRLQRKIDNGADYIMTQPAFHHEPLALLEKLRGRTPFIIGVMVLTGLDHARRMARVPGVVIPTAILQRLSALPDPADQAKIGQDIAAEQIRQLLRDGWQGLYLMSTAGIGNTLGILRAGLI